MIFKSQVCAIYVIIYIYSLLVIYIYFFIKRNSMVFIALHPHSSNWLLKMSLRSLLALQVSGDLWSLAWSSDIPVQIWCLSQHLHAPSTKNEARAHQQVPCHQQPLMIILVVRQAIAEKMHLCSSVVSTSRRQQICLSSDSWQGSDQRRVRQRCREGKVAASGGESWEENSCVPEGGAWNALCSHSKGQLKMAADCSKKKNTQKREKHLPCWEHTAAS